MGQAERQAAQLAHLRQRKSEENQCRAIQEAGKPIQHAAIQLQPGQEAHGGRRDQDGQCWHHAPRQRIMKNQPVHHQHQQHDPKDHPGRKEYPRGLGETEADPRDRRHHVAHSRNEPRGRDVEGLKRPVANPVRQYRQRQAGLAAGPHQPHGAGHLRQGRFQGCGNQQEGNGEGGKEGQFHRMLPFCRDRLWMA